MLARLQGMARSLRPGRARPITARLGYPRPTEAGLLLVAILLTFLGFFLGSAGLLLRDGQNPQPAVLEALWGPVIVSLVFIAIHVLLVARGVRVEQILLPVTAMLFAIGITMIWRLRGPAGLSQQVLRGLVPGALVMALFIIRPQFIERIRQWTLPISVVGLILPLLTAFFGVVDETGARLALKLGPLPPIQTSELVKVVLIIFLAWYIEREGRAAEGRALPVLIWLRMPSIHYFIPGVLFVALATLALVQMSDFGAVLILGFIFIGMLYAGFETRIFVTIAAIGVGLSLLAGLVLSLTWEVPAVIQQRFLAFQDPWSTAELVVNGQPTGVTISAGPGYQIQQAVYATIAGGLTGAGLGLGSPEYVPLAQSDFIYAAILEEMGSLVGIAALILFIILLLRILRVAVLLPRGQVFERLLLTGIAIHLFTQVLIMVGGTLNLLPLTGVTIPFLSLGGVALLVNLAEVGMALALAQRLEGTPR